jgi:hypothetical protein
MSSWKKHSPSGSDPVHGLTSKSTQLLPPRQPPLSPESQPQSHRQQQQQWPVHPWSEHRLNLLPPTFLSENSPPSGPSPSPFPRFGHALFAAATAAGELILFGGFAQHSIRNDLYVFSTRDFSATLLQTSGEVPSPRAGLAGARFGTNILIWGGATKIGDQNKFIGPYDESLYLLNLGTLDLLISRQTLADYSLLRSSLARVDPRRGQWSRSRRSLLACSNDGWFHALRIWWSKRREAFE